MKIGDIVRYNTGDTRKLHDNDPALGRVCAHEKYADDQDNAREWWYVRWFSDDGMPESAPVKHHLNELVPAGRAD